MATTDGMSTTRSFVLIFKLLGMKTGENRICIREAKSVQVMAGRRLSLFLFAEKTLQNPLQVLDQRGLPGFDQGWHGDDAAHAQKFIYWFHTIFFIIKNQNELFVITWILHQIVIRIQYLACNCEYFSMVVSIS